MVTEISPYIQFKRKNTEGQTDVELNLYNKELELSHAIDTPWVIARSQASKNGRQQTIPNWTGYNYFVCNDDDNSFHKIGYLPAINQSPTSHDTVLELLSQSKLKAEKINRRDQKPPKQFKKYLSDGSNKVHLVKFLLLDWSDPERFREVIMGRAIFLIVECKAYRLQVVEN